MKIALELEFADEQAALVMRTLQDLPEMTFRFLRLPPDQQPTFTLSNSAAPISAAERMRLVEEFAGSWQSDEDGTELARQLREARYFRDRDGEV